MFIDFDEIEEDQNKQGPNPSNRRQDHEDHSSRPFRAHTHGKTSLTNMDGKTNQTNMDGNLCPKTLY